MKQVLVSGVLVAALACGNPSGPGETLVVRAVAPQLEITNRTQAAVFYIVINQSAVAYTDWVPGVNGPHVNAGNSVSLTYSQIVGYTTGATKATVYWWQAVPGPADTPQPGRIQQITVTL